ncbi:FecR family protein [Niabella hirudinis]|uniref:FecR family protein n=1 Tax=Niabella hirudinis TaxID=1285929 RepID=UPI003EB915A6
MAAMDPYLIKKFLNNECSSKEAEAVSAFFAAHPEVLDQYFSIEEWQDALNGTMLTAGQKQTLKKIIDKKTGGRALKLSLFRYAAAAVLLLAVAVAVVYISTRQPQTADYARVIISNFTRASKDTLLPDGSRVLLLSGARLSYQQDFIKKRWVTVEEGTVQFEEKKTGTPFTAWAQGIAITPVGTLFTVSSTPANATVEIALQEGLVKVYAANKKMNDVVLTPGDRLFIHVGTMEVTLSHPEKKQAAGVPKEAAAAVKKSAPEDAVWTNNAITFSQTALPVVFDKIMDKYNVPIVYDQEQIARYHFTGAIYYNDAIDKLLKNICEVNGLEYHYRNDSIIITRSAVPHPKEKQ